MARLTLVLLCVLAALPAGAHAANRIVVFDRGLPADAVERLRAAGITRAALFPDARAAAVRGPAAAYRRISRWRDVVALYRERRFRLNTFQSKPSLGVDRIHAGAAPLPRPYTGKGVTVAVFDTGIEDSHPDLDDRVAANLYFEASGLLDDITDGEYSRSHAETPAGFDELQHGTLVGGIIAGTGESATGADMRGMAPEATLVNFKLIGEATHEFPNDLISEASALAAYQWMLDHRTDPRFPGGIRVASNSWGWDGNEFEPLAFANILQASADAGVALVFAAGNSGPGPDTVGFPARLPWIISVGATCKAQGVWSDRCPDGAGQVADFSSRGETVDVTAPGVDVWGAFAKFGFEQLLGQALGAAGTMPPPPGEGDPAAELNNRAHYVYSAGTSFATPHVGGIVALMLEANPRLTHAQIERILQQTATDIGEPGFDTSTGFGEVNAFEAVELAAAAPAAAPGSAPPAGPPPSAGAPAPADAAPRCSLAGRRTVTRRAPRVRVRCDEAAAVTATLRIGRRAFAAGRRIVPAGRATTVRLAVRSWPRRARGATLTLAAVDGAGNRAASRVKLRLTR